MESAAGRGADESPSHVPRPPEGAREVTAVAPIRICDVGGWTDTWFARRGKVFNIAVSPSVEVRVRARSASSDSPRIRLEIVNFGDRYGYEPGGPPGRHPLLEAVIDEVGLPDDAALEIRVASEAPPGCSTGTSAAVAVALVGALEALQPGPRRHDPDEVARAAHRIEVERLGLQSGVQDQVCAAYGGINFVAVDPYPHVTRTSVPVSVPLARDLEDRLLLLYLGRAHRSSEMHERVTAHLLVEGEESPQLGELRDCAVMARDAVVAENLDGPDGLGRAMIRNTDAQRRLHPDLVSAQAQAAIEVATAHGAAGWKINGAGGDGGSLTILGHPDAARRRGMRDDLLATDPSLQVIPIRLDADGLRVTRT